MWKRCGADPCAGSPGSGLKAREFGTFGLGTVG